ncbi:MAG: Ig-like domain-containing protein [Bacillota bacterium]|nr:Ig-like domain-containing protein [Bacillota bacterium]
MVLYNKLLRKSLKPIMAAIVAVLFLVAGSASIHADDSQLQDNGNLKWSMCLDAKNGRVTPPAYDDGFIYTASGSILYKINADSGEVADKVPFDGNVGHATIPVTIGGNWIFVALDASKVAIINKNDMTSRTIKYAENENKSQTISPIIYDAAKDCAYTGSWMVERDNGKRVISGSYAAIDVATGETTVIQQSDTGFYWTGACIKGKFVVFGSNANGSDDNAPCEGIAKLYCYNSETKETVSCDVEGSVCSTVIEHNGKFYFTTKAGKLYEAAVSDEGIIATEKLKLGSAGTGNLIIRDNKIYAGCKTGIVAANLNDWTATNYTAPADVKHIAVVGDRMLCTYNQSNGGIYDPIRGYEYFTPDAGMKGYCISDIATNGSTVYYKNDSGYIMAVETAPVNVVCNKVYEYDGKVVEPDISVMYKGKKLADGQDYEIDTSDLNGAGNRILTVSGKGNYSFNQARNINIAKGRSQIKCKTSIQKAYGASAFDLGASADGKMTFTSSSPSVVKVSENGKVTVKGMGKSTITIKAGETDNYLPGTFKVTMTVVPKTVTGVKVKSGKKKMTVKWSKMSGITGYQIAYSRNAKFASGNKYAYVTKYSTVSKTIKKLTKKKYYYVKVRAYKTVGGTKYYGSYSSVRKAKIR